MPMLRSSRRSMVQREHTPTHKHIRPRNRHAHAHRETHTIHTDTHLHTHIHTQTYTCTHTCTHIGESEVVGSTRVRRSERYGGTASSPATSTSGNSNGSEEEAAAASAAAQLGGRAVQLSRVLSVARSGFAYQPPSAWMEEFRGAAATGAHAWEVYGLCSASLVSSLC